MSRQLVDKICAEDQSPRLHIVADGELYDIIQEISARTAGLNYDFTKKLSGLCDHVWFDSSLSGDNSLARKFIEFGGKNHEYCEIAARFGRVHWYLGGSPETALTCARTAYRYALAQKTRASLECAANSLRGDIA